MKNFKRIVTLFCTAVVAVVGSVTVNAADINETKIVLEGKPSYMGGFTVDDPEYTEYVSKLTVSESEDKLAVLLDNDTYDYELYHIYEPTKIGNTYYFCAANEWDSEFAVIKKEVSGYNPVTEKSSRVFVEETLYLQVVGSKNGEIDANIDTINNFLEGNGYNARILQTYTDKNGTLYYIEYGDSLDFKDKIDVLYALKCEFGVFAVSLTPDSSGVSVAYASDLSLTSAVKLQRYLSHSAELDSNGLTDFDLNGDGDLNVIDLIMMKRKLTDMNK